LPAAVVACLLAVGAPALAATPPTPSPNDVATADTPETGLDTTDVTTTPDVTSTTATDTTTATTIAGSAASQLVGTGSGAVTGPASAAGAMPTRGPQVQLATPPPSPFDPPPNTGFGRRVVYSKTQQTVWVYDETDTIIKAHRVSGRQDPRDPLPGTYRVWSRSARTFSINNPTITWNYMIRFAKGDRDGNIGFHDIPYQYGQPVQTVDQLGQALSGGCVRQAPEDAIWMWNWAQIGTVVVVTP
jgi:lipoprotein-anchoring transpeptidase ErfK/SrfK